LTNTEFVEVLGGRITKIAKVLNEKSKEYASAGDRLHNFKRAGLMQGVTPEKALVGMLVKHLVCVMDMVDDIERGNIFWYGQWDEKIGDSINYLCLLEALAVERLGGVPQCTKENLEESAIPATNMVKED
jgi:hypothetical protein